MAWDEVVAALLGGLGGGVEGWQFSKKSKQQERDRKALEGRQAEEDRYRAEQRDWQREDREQRARDRERRDAEDLLTSFGRDAVLTPEQSARVGAAGLDHRMRPEETLDTSFFSTGGDGEITRSAAPGQPTGRMMVAPTAAQRAADLAASEKARVAAAERQQMLDMVKNLPPHMQQAAQFGLASGKMPTFGTTEFVSPEERTDQEIAREVKKANALLPTKLREREALNDVERRGRFDLPIKDDPALPRGVRAYLGDLAARPEYQTDPAAARAELQRAAPNLLRDHPNLDMAKVIAQMNAMLPMPQLTDDEKEAAAKERMAAAAAKQAPGSSASLPAPASPKPVAAPLSRPAPSGTVRMQAPTGQVQDVPAALIEHYKALGGKVIQ